MPSLSTLLGLAAVITALIDAKPIFNGKELRQLDNGFAKRQDGEGEDVDTEAIDALRHAVDYASVFSAQSTATYSAVSVGSAPSEATLVATTTVAPGTKAVGSPPEPREQGDKYVVDHILELQFVVGAFSVNTRPTSIPLENWNAVSSACFSPAPKNYPPRTAVASAFGQAFNLQGIPSRFNGFKGQVFAGRFKSNPDNPSGRTYPADFGPALRKFLEENEQDFYSAMDDVGEALAGDGVGNYPGIKDYFTAYAQAEFQSATEFLSTWIGTSYTRTSTATKPPSPAPLPAAPRRIASAARSSQKTVRHVAVMGLVMATQMLRRIHQTCPLQPVHRVRALWAQATVAQMTTNA
ncbi:MAG: hypothetical protein LQ346_004729 [Caloplaca aetnensis]|nr:MAG: hypothetical protein LQ346_004729 [Caloplaca aetnensis]